MQPSDCPRHLRIMQLHQVQKKIFSVFPFTLPINYFLIFGGGGEFLKTFLQFFWDYFCVCVWVQAHAWMQVPLEAKRCPEDELSASCEPPNMVYGNQAWVFWESSKSTWLQSHLFSPLGASFEDITSELHSSVGRQDLIKKNVLCTEIRDFKQDSAGFLCDLKRVN